MEKPSAYQGDDSHVFVCYAHEDADAVYPEIAWLQGEGVNVWYDEGISLGTEWTEALADAIQGCTKFLFFVTPNSVTREHCRRELNFAQEEVREILAVHLQPTEASSGLRLSLNNRQAIFKYELSEDKYRRELSRAILGATARPATKATFQPPRRAPRSAIFVVTALLISIVGTWLFNSATEVAVVPEPVETGLGDSTSTDVLHNSIAVLPFDNLSPNPDDAYFAAGIHEEVINQLVGIRDLSVISRTSVMEYAAVHKPIEDIARELGVVAVMKGSVRYAGNRVRITAQLIDGKSGAHLWSKAYEDSLKDIFGIQLAIATQIAGTLEARFSPAEQSRIGTRPTENPEAYASYLRAASAWGNYSPTGPFHEALDIAIELDPKFAEALAFKAFVHSIEAAGGEAFFGPEFGPDEQQRFASLSVEYANRALEIDSQQARAHYALQWVHTINREWEASQRHAARAYELSPNDYIVLNGAAWDALARGAVDDAIDFMERSSAIAPGDLASQGNFALLLQHAQRWDYAKRQGLLAAKLIPDFTVVLAEILAYSGDIEGARANAAIVEAGQPDEFTLSVIAGVYRRIGDIEGAERLFDQWHRAGVPISTHPRTQYNWHAAVGHTDAAIEQLEKGLDQGFPWGFGRDLHYHSKHPLFDPIRTHPKFEELVRRAALPLIKSE